MTNQQQNLTDLTDLEWTAFCYVVDELDGPARATFEQQLATETAACEALARMVRLHEAMVLAEEAVPAPTVAVSATAGGHWGGLVTALAVLSLCVVVGVFGLRPSAEPDGASESTGIVAAESDLADAWVAAEDPLGGDLLADADLPDLDEADGRFDSAGDVPDWMFAAFQPEGDEE